MTNHIKKVKSIMTYYPDRIVVKYNDVDRLAKQFVNEQDNSDIPVVHHYNLVNDERLAIMEDIETLLPTNYSVSPELDNDPKDGSDMMVYYPLYNDSYLIASDKLDLDGKLELHKKGTNFQIVVDNIMIYEGKNKVDAVDAFGSCHKLQDLILLAMGMK